MAPIETIIDSIRTEVPAGKTEKRFLERLHLEIKGRFNGGVVSFEQDSPLTNIETTGKPLISLSGETVHVHLHHGSKLRILGQKETIVLVGKNNKSRKTK